MTMNGTSQRPLTMDEVRQRVDRVFKFLAEVARRRAPVVRRWQEHFWKLVFSELPDHPDVTRVQRTTDGQVIVLRVRRPKETPCPPPPSQLVDWVLPGWADVNQDARYLPTRNLEVAPTFPSDNDSDVLFRTTVTIAFEDDQARVDLFDTWKTQRDKWRDAERPVRRVGAVYQRLFELQGRLERESERLALWVGDGLLRADTPVSVEYPLLVQRCELLFDSKIPAFEIRETSEPPELATPLLRELQVDGRTLVNLREKLAALDIDILDTDAKHFLAEAAHALFPKCDVLQERPAKAVDHPAVFRDPVVFASHRTGGMVTAIDSFLRRLHETGEIPGPLRDIIVSEPINAEEQICDQDEQPNDPPTTTPHLQRDDRPPLLTKPANPEQEAVVTTLERDGAVVVQSPPGTGKTHTIANLLGHFLAHGKTVLVTSHTTKALRVLREKVVEDLRPLCVSVLDRDAESRQQLEESVKGIVQGLATSREEHLRQADQADTARQRTWKKLRVIEQDLRRSIRDQYDDIIVDGETISPVAAARLINSEGASHAWLPGPLEPGRVCPLLPNEIRELFATTDALSAMDEADLTEQLPPIKRLPTPVDFSSNLSKLAALADDAKRHDTAFWRKPTSNIELVCQLIQRVRLAITTICQADKLTLECMNAGRLAGVRRHPWDDLLETFQRLGGSIDNATALTIRFAPSVSSNWPLQRQQKTTSDILAHLSKGRSLHKFGLLFRPSWKAFLARCTVRGTNPQSLEDLQAISAFYKVKADRDELCRRWQLQIEPLDGLPVAQLGDRPEDTTRQFA